MNYRPPTVDEITSRVRAFSFWFALAVYALIAFGGAAVFAHFVHDGEWQEIFFSVWWIPPGVAAWWTAGALRNYLCGYVPDQPGSDAA